MYKEEFRKIFDKIVKDDRIMILELSDKRRFMCKTKLRFIGMLKQLDSELVVKKSFNKLYINKIYSIHKLHEIHFINNYKYTYNIEWERDKYVANTKILEPYSEEWIREMWKKHEVQ